jgi:hypothetical protein
MLASLLVLALALAAAPADPTAVCPVPESLSPVERIEACEARLAKARGAERDRLLLALGLLHADLPRLAYRCREPGSGCPSHDASPAERALKAHADASAGEFERHEASDTLASTGLHLRRLLAASPRGPLAEPAAAALAAITPAFGCDGQSPCEVQTLVFRFPRPAEYLERFPRGAHAAVNVEAARRLLAEAATALGDSSTALGQMTEELDELRREVKPLLVRAGALAARLEARSRGATCGAAAEVAVALVLYPQADPLLRCAAASPDSNVVARARVLTEKVREARRAPKLP